MEITKVLSIKEAGHNEEWLRDLIFEEPTILGLGNLTPLMKEVVQVSGGRLDLLLENDEDRMYEVELQLGATNETHIIRTLEYWENERRRWPNRSHTAVLVAEQITNRFYNVVALLSNSVPIIGIQANIVEVGGQQALHFTKIIDSYREPEVTGGTEDRKIDEAYWQTNYPGSLGCAQWVRTLLMKYYPDVEMRYFPNRISFMIGGAVKVIVFRRTGDQAYILIRCAGFEEATAYLDKCGMLYNTNVEKQELKFSVSVARLEQKAEVYEWIIKRLVSGEEVGEAKN